MDPQDHHHVAARAAIERHHQRGNYFLLPASALAEVMVGYAIVDPTSVERQYGLITATFGSTRLIDDEVALRAALLRAEHASLRLPDALVLAVGIVEDADTIVTADKKWLRYSDRVELL